MRDIERIGLFCAAVTYKLQPVLYDGPTQLRWTILTSTISSAALQELCLFDLPMLSGLTHFLHSQFTIEVQQCLPWHQRSDT